MYPLTLGLVIENKQLQDEVHGCLGDLPLRVVLQQADAGDPGVLAERVERMRPDLVLIDVTNPKTPLEEIVRQVRATSVAPLVIALHTSAEPATILSALRAGANEFLYTPLAVNLRSALERFSHERMASQRANARGGGKVAGFLSAKGGCGATMLACHAAVEIQRQTSAKVLLADLDVEAGLVGFLMKSKSPYSILDAYQNLHRLDTSYWKALVYSNGIPDLEIVAAPPRGAQQLPGEEQVRTVLRFARMQYPWTVVDLGRSLTHAAMIAMDELDYTCLVTTLDIPALHRAKQIIQTVLDSGYGRQRLHVILNRMPKRVEITLEELERMLGVPIYATLPNDYEALSESYADGKLLPSASPLNRQIAKFAGKLAGVDEQQKKKRTFSIFG